MSTPRSLVSHVVNKEKQYRLQTNDHILSEIYLLGPHPLFFFSYGCTISKFTATKYRQNPDNAKGKTRIKGQK